MKIGQLCAAFLGLAALALTGCNNNPYPAGESQGNVLYRTLGEDPKSLDPTFSYTVDEAYVCDVIYPSFYNYHPIKRPFAITLNIGASEPVRKAVPGGEEWRFTFRKDLRFQDDPCFPGGKGRAITANDVVYSFKRMCDPKNNCPVASFFEDKVLGWKEYSKVFADALEAKDEAARAKNYDAILPGVTVDPADPYTVVIKLNQAYPQLKYLMAMHFTTPQAREAVEKYGDEYTRHPVGSGPYMMSRYEPKQRVELTVNPNRFKAYYPTKEGITPEDIKNGWVAEAEKNGWLLDAGKQLPLADKVVFSIVKESTSAWNLFLQGYLDSAGVNNNNYQQVVANNGGLSDEMKARGITLRRDPQVNVYYCAFNMEDETFGGYTPQKRKLRQAISMAIDADEFIQLIIQGNGQKAEWMIPPGVFGNDEKFKNPYREVNIEKAKQLLAEAGYPDGNDPKTGRKLVLGYDNSATTAIGMQQVALLQRQIERIGIKVESRSTNANQFQERLLKGQHQFIFYGWFADYPDPENFVFLLYGPNKKPGPNAASYKNAEYDKLFEQMRIMNDGPERRAIIDKMRAIEVEDCPWIPIYHSLSMGLSYDWLKNTMAHPIANDMAQYRRVDFQDRARKQAEWNKPIWIPVALVFVLLGLGLVPAAKVVQQRVNRKLRQGGGS
ncbi:MAG: ABC transporter substrate-binding protein [Armatimonas sp.]